MTTDIRLPYHEWRRSHSREVIEDYIRLGYLVRHWEYTEEAVYSYADHYIINMNDQYAGCYPF